MKSQVFTLGDVEVSGDPKLKHGLSEAFSGGSTLHSLEMFWWHVLFCPFKRTLWSWVQIPGMQWTQSNNMQFTAAAWVNSLDALQKMHPLSSLTSVFLHKMIARPSTQIRFVQFESECPNRHSHERPSNPLSYSWGWLIVGQSELSDLRAAMGREQKISVAGGK